MDVASCPYIIVFTLGISVAIMYVDCAIALTNYPHHPTTLHSLLSTGSSCSGIEYKTLVPLLARESRGIVSDFWLFFFENFRSGIECEKATRGYSLLPPSSFAFVSLLHLHPLFATIHPVKGQRLRPQQGQWSTHSCPQYRGQVQPVRETESGRTMIQGTHSSTPLTF